MPATPELVGGSADLTGSNLTFVKGMGTVAPGNFAGRYIHYGIREHGMAAAANGMALHGGLIPYTGTFFVFTDYMRPAIRLGAIMRAARDPRADARLRSASARTGRRTSRSSTSPACAPCRTCTCYRPADTMETAECWELAIRRTDGPSLLVLTRQALPTHAHRHRPRTAAPAAATCWPRPTGRAPATLIATGSEVSIAMAARDALAAEGISVAVVSLPCWELFAQQDEAYRAQRAGRRAARRHRGRRRVRLGALAGH